MQGRHSRFLAGKTTTVAPHRRKARPLGLGDLASRGGPAMDALALTILKK